MSEEILGTNFNYKVDRGYGINQDGFIAEGTESIVYKGIREGNGLRYACVLKFKPKARLKDFMEREYKILESLQTCRSVVRIFDVIEDLKDFSMPHKDIEVDRAGYFCVVEEYIDGDSLQDYCIKQWYAYNTDKKKWERNSTKYVYREIVKFQGQIIQFMINLCEIMKFVSNIGIRNDIHHENEEIVLHCDIKPENIMVTKHGKELVLIDFGRSQIVTKGLEERTYQYYSNIREKSFVADYSEKQWQDIGKENLYAYGTVGYAAPECYAEAGGGTYPFESQHMAFTSGCVSIESDIFGFGATFLECMSIYEICNQAFVEASDVSDIKFFNNAIQQKAEQCVCEGAVERYCDRDYRGLDESYHELVEDILRKCTRTRKEGFRDAHKTPEEYYHNFYQIQNDVERANEMIPSIDRKSDPLVRQMIGISGFCAAFACSFLMLFIVLTVFANTLARDRWEALKQTYTDNQKAKLNTVAESMVKVCGEKNKLKNLEDILQFMYGGSPNDSKIDKDEAEIFVGLLKDGEDYRVDPDRCGIYLDTIIQNGKSDNMDDIAETVYRFNLPEKYKSKGYDLAKALTQMNYADEKDSKRLVPVYEALMQYKDDSDYQTILSKLAMRLMQGDRVDTIAAGLGTNREAIRNELLPLERTGGE